MYSTRPGLILAFHGCDQSIVNTVLTGKTSLEKSNNKYDWLGHGIYFWDNSPSCALEYASFLKHHPERTKNKIENPAVIGAIINLGYCLDLLDFENLQLLKSGFDLLSAAAGPQSSLLHVYHKTDKCMGLDSCRNNVHETTLDSAMGYYKRRACKVCYKQH